MKWSALQSALVVLTLFRNCTTLFRFSSPLDAISQKRKVRMACITTNIFQKLNKQ